jgi:hypothetical protein
MRRPQLDDAFLARSLNQPSHASGQALLVGAYSDWKSDQGYVEDGKARGVSKATCDGLVARTYDLFSLGAAVVRARAERNTSPLLVMPTSPFAGY